MSEIVRGMTAEDFARALGHDSAWVRTEGVRLGKLAAEGYRSEWGQEPPKTGQVINGREVTVAIYPYGRQHHLRESYVALLAADQGQLEDEPQQGPVEPAETAQELLGVLLRGKDWMGRQDVLRAVAGRFSAGAIDKAAKALGVRMMQGARHNSKMWKLD